ncbi:MAG TPA: hypothetical protein VE988_00475 [Gemmataceae bacterium]|nr:hypothetical protein [Gemmataceae bacterium]
MPFNPGDPEDDKLTREFFRGCFPAWFVDFYLCRNTYLNSIKGHRRSVVWLLLWIFDIGIAFLVWAVAVMVIPPDYYATFLQSILIGLVSGYLLARYWCSHL